MYDALVRNSRSRSSKVIDFGTNRKLAWTSACKLHCFGDFNAKIAYILPTSLIKRFWSGWTLSNFL